MRGSGATRRPGEGRRPLTIALTVLLILLSVLLAANWGLSGANADGPSLSVSSPEQARAGEPIDVALILHNASDVGGYQVRASFGPLPARLEGVSHSDSSIAMLGRFIQTIGPLEQSGGASWGMFSCAGADCSSAGKGDGASGDVVLGTFTVVADGTGPLTISLSGLRLSDASGVPIALANDAASVTVFVTEEQE